MPKERNQTIADTMFIYNRATAFWQEMCIRDSHLQSAMENGFNPISAQCQVIIADGLKGTDYREIPVDGEYCPAPKIGTAIALSLIHISHGHSGSYYHERGKQNGTGWILQLSADFGAIP